MSTLHNKGESGDTSSGSDCYPPFLLLLPGKWGRIVLETDRSIRASVRGFVNEVYGRADKNVLIRKRESERLIKIYGDLARRGGILSFISRDIGFGIQVPISIHVLRPPELLFPKEIVGNMPVVEATFRSALRSNENPVQSEKSGFFENEVNGYKVFSRYRLNEISEAVVSQPPTSDARNTAHDVMADSGFSDEDIANAWVELDGLSMRDSHDLGQIIAEFFVVHPDFAGVTIVIGVCPVEELYEEVVDFLNQVITFSLADSRV